MDENAIGQQHYTGDTCAACDCELVLVTAASGEVYVECDCGTVTCIGSGDVFSPAA